MYSLSSGRNFKHVFFTLGSNIPFRIALTSSLTKRTQTVPKERFWKNVPIRVLFKYGKVAIVKHLTTMSGLFVIFQLFGFYIILICKGTPVWLVTIYVPLCRFHIFASSDVTFLYKFAHFQLFLKLRDINSLQSSQRAACSLDIYSII